MHHPVRKCTEGSHRRHPGGALRALLGMVLALSLVGVALAQGARDPNTLVIANAVAVDSFDPADNTANETIWMTQILYERLVQPNADGTEIIPQLASSWEVSDDGLVYTFHLRDATFHDGTPVTSGDVKYSIQRSKDYEGGWGFLLSSLESIDTPDDKTVVMTLSHPWAPMLADLAMYAYAVIPQHAVESEGLEAFLEHPIGSGPFAFDSWDKGTSVLFKRYDGWWGDAPNIEYVKYMIVPNDNSRVLLLQNKEADIIENPPGNLLNQIEKTPGINTALFDSTRMDFLILNHNYAPLSDVKVRQAINYAIDREALVKLVLSGYGSPATSFFPKDMLYFDSDLQGYPYDVEKAKQLMAESSYPDGFDTDLVEVSNDAVGNGTAIIVKQNLAEIGINVNIQNYELATAYDKERQPDAQMGQRYWTNDIIDPDEVVTFAVDKDAGAHAFFTWYDNPHAVDLVNTARTELDPDKRRAMYYEIQQIMNDDAVFVPLFYSPYRYATGEWVQGFHVSPLGNYNLSLQTLQLDK